MPNKHTTIYKLELEGLSKLIKGFEEIRENLPTRDLQALAEIAVKSFEPVSKALKEGVDLSNVKDSINDMMKALEQMRIGTGMELARDGVTVDVKHFDETVDDLTKKVEGYTARRKSLEEDLVRKQAEMTDMAEKVFRKRKQAENDNILDHRKATAELDKLKEESSRIEKEGTKEEQAAFKKRLENQENFVKELGKYYGERKTLGSQLGGVSRAENIANRKLGEAKIKQADTEKFPIEDIKKESQAVQELMKFYNDLVDAQKDFLKIDIERKHQAAEKAEKKHTEETKKAAKAQEELDEAVKKGEKSLGRKVLAGISYYTVFNQVKKIIRDSIRAITELDKAMTKAAIVTSMTRKESWELLKTYQNLAQETGKTTSEIANLNAFFLQQGKSVKQAMEMTEAAAKSAAVAGSSLQDAANYITSAIHGFGLAASQAENVGNKFAALGASSASSFEEIAIAMSKVAPVAQSAGVGIDFMMGILAKGIHTTREAPEAIGTAMKTIFARMRELTDIGKATEDGMSLNRVEKAVNSIGVSLRDVSGQFRNLEDVLTDVGMKWHTLNSMEQAYLATALAGTRQQPRLLAILNDFETTMKMVETSRNAEDELMFQHMDYMESMEAATNSLRNSWEQIVTSIVSSDAIIGVMNALSSVFSGVASTIGFIADRAYLMIPALIAITLLTVSLTKKLIVKRGVDLARYAQGIKQQIQYQKTLFLMKRTNSAIRAETRETIKLTAAEQANVTSATLLSFVNIGLTAVMKLLKRAIDAVTRAFQWLWVNIIPVLVVMLAIVAVAALIYGLVKAVQYLTRSVDHYGKAIDEANKKMHESQKKVKAIKELQKEYDELANKVGKTNEELERMNELMDEIEGTEEGRFVMVDAFGNREIDHQAIRKYEKEEELKQAKEESKAYRKARTAVSRYGKEALENTSVKNQLMKSGVRMVDSMTKGMDDELAYKVKSASQKALKGINMQDFVKAQTSIDPYTGEETEDGHYFDFDSYRDEVERVTETLTTAFEDIDSVIKDKTLDSASALRKQLEHIQTAVGEDGFGSAIAAGLRQAYPEMVKLTEIMESLSLGAKEFSDIITSLVSKGGSVEVLVDYAAKTGMGASYVGDHDTYEDYLDSTEEVRNQIAEAQKLRDQYEDEYLDHSEKGHRVRAKNRKKRMQEQEDLIAKLEEQLPEGDLRAAEFAFKMEEYQKDALLFAAGDLDKEGLRALVTGVADAYQAVDSELSREDAIKKAYDLYIPMVQSPEETAEAIKRNQALITDSLKIADEVRKGDFSNYLKLVEEVGADAAQSFMETGDITGIQGKMLENRKEKLLDAINLLEIQKEESGLDGSEEAILETYRYMYMNMDNMVDRWAVWNHELEKTKQITDQMNKNFDFLDKLQDLEIDIDIKDSLLSSIESLTDMAIDEMEKDMEESYSQREKDWEALQKAGLVKDGKILSPTSESEKRLVDAFFESNDYFIESAEASIKMVQDQINRYKKEKEKEIKILEDSHKERMDLLKKQHDERWKALEYEKKILDLQEKITEARNRLASAMFGGDIAGQHDAQKALKEAREARQKEVETQILDRIQREEERIRDEAIADIQEDIEDHTGRMATALESLLNREGGEGLRVILTNPTEVGGGEGNKGSSSKPPMGPSPSYASDIAFSIMTGMSKIGNF